MPRAIASWCIPVAVLIAMFCAGGCGGDWDTKLVKGYSIGSTGESPVQLWKGDGSSDTLAPGESIAEFGFSDHWIQLKLVPDGSATPPIKNRYVLVDADTGATQRFASQDELTLALPPNIPTMTWKRAGPTGMPWIAYAALGVFAAVFVVVTAVVAASVALRARSRRSGSAGPRM